MSSSTASTGQGKKKPCHPRCSGETDSKEKIMARINMAEVEPASVSWLWEGRIARGKLTLIDGDPGEGKSLVTLDIAARLSQGRPMPLEEAAGCGASASLFLTCEDDPAETVRPRLIAADADPSLIHVRQDLLTIPDHLGIIEQDLRETGARLLVIDPLNGYMGRVNTSSDLSVRAVLMPLAQMAARLGVAVVGVRHFAKARGGSALHRGLGSTAYAGIARSVLAVGADPEDARARILAVSKGNLAGDVPSLRFRRVIVDGSARIEWEGPCDVCADALCAGPKGADDHRASREARDFLLANLAVGERLADDLYKEAKMQGIAERTLRRAKSQLGTRDRRDGTRWLWMLRDQAPASRPSGQPAPNEQDPGHLANRPSGQRPAPQSPFGPPQESQEEEPVGQVATWPAGGDPVEPEGLPKPALAPKKSGGYIHHRTRKDMFRESGSLGIPDVAMKHWRLLKDGIKPTKEGFLAAEDLIAKVKAAKAAGQDPAPLWAPYMPPPLPAFN